MGESRPGRLSTNYKGLADFRPYAFSTSFSTVVEIFGGRPYVPVAGTSWGTRRLTAGKGLYHSNSAADNDALTPSAPVRYYLSFPRFGWTEATEVSNSHGQGRTHISAEPPPPQADPRVPRPHGDQEGPAGPRAPARQGAEAPCRYSFAVVPSNTLPPARRIRRRAEFQRVFDAGRRAHGRYLTVIAAPAAGPDSRIGIVASKKLGGAVVRNRAKRLIREMFRTSVGPERPCDLVIIPKPSALQVKVAEVVSDYSTTLRRLSLSKQ